MKNAARLILAALMALALPANGSCSRGENRPGQVTVCFALTQENMAQKEMDMWGCKILQEE